MTREVKDSGEKSRQIIIFFLNSSATLSRGMNFSFKAVKRHSVVLDVGCIHAVSVLEAEVLFFLNRGLWTLGGG